ncbi:basic secretory protein-like protein [Paucibacter sp. AS339]|uniref:basic secretory protein-like protein n=1 Tax=Paucibacter hankyongi TaxID=3133434 RepID=UPI0030966906
MNIRLFLSLALLAWSAARAELPPAAPKLSPTVAPDDAGWVRVATPAVDYKNDGSPGAQAFAALVPDIDRYVHAIARGVVQRLYKSPADVPAFKTLELRIREWHGEKGSVEPQDGIAWKDGEPPERIIVNVNTRWLEKYAAKGGNMADEVKGILFHEMVHAYQHYEGMHGAALESLADLVRYQAGFGYAKDRRVGGSYTDPYKSGAFFFAYLVEQKGFADFGPCFNATAKPGSQFKWTWENAIGACAGGGDVKALWSEYQAWIPTQTTK